MNRWTCIYHFVNLSSDSVSGTYKCWKAYENELLFYPSLVMIHFFVSTCKLVNLIDIVM